jgi:hypothetical protein
MVAELAKDAFAPEAIIFLRPWIQSSQFLDANLAGEDPGSTQQSQ